jgi:hypothetical protein
LLANACKSRCTYSEFIDLCRTVLRVHENRPANQEVPNGEER